MDFYFVYNEIESLKNFKSYLDGLIRIEKALTWR